MLAHRVRTEAILERSSLIVERAGRDARSFLKRVHRRLIAARVRGMSVYVKSVRLGGNVSPAGSFVVVGSEEFADVRVYVGARAVGVHLEVLLLTAVEPGWLKRATAGLVRQGAWWSWSLPSGITRQEQLRTLLTVVEATVHAVARKTAQRLTGLEGLLPPERGSVLDQWS